MQGVLTAFGLWISGVPRPVLLGAVAGFLVGAADRRARGLDPGRALADGHRPHSAGASSWRLRRLVVSGADNVIRPWFIARGAQLPFLLTILGVLGGALAFGLLGIFLGPVLLGIGFTLVAEFSGDQRRRRSN